jgi:hypothetical protein
MKFEFPFIQKLHLSAFIKNNHGKLTHSLVNPSREWNTSLLVTLLVTAGLLAYAGVDFYEQYTDSNRPEVNEEHIPKYRAQDAELLIRYHDGRREVFDTLRLNRPNIPKQPPVSPESAILNGSGGGEDLVAGAITAE